MTKNKVVDIRKDRIKQIFATDEYKNFSGVLLTSQPNIFYFTGFNGDDSWALLTPKKTIIITDGRYDIQAHQQSPTSRIIVRKTPMPIALAGALKRSSKQNIGMITSEVSLLLATKLADACSNVNWHPVTDAPILSLRQTKTADEIKKIKKALAISQAAFLDLLDDLQPGRTENEIAAELEYRMRAYGADKAAFDTIVACGPNAAKPHALASSKKIIEGKPIIFDFGARLEGYCSDLTRTVYLGKMPSYFKNMYSVCLDAQLSAIDAIKPGMPVAEADKIARDVITRAKLGKYFTHSLGHGFGLDVHEAPYVSGQVDQILTPGMVVTVEPGIYVPGKGGVRIEDDVLITQTGCKVLSDLPKAIEDVIIR